MGAPNIHGTGNDMRFVEWLYYLYTWVTVITPKSTLILRLWPSFISLESWSLHIFAKVGHIKCYLGITNSLQFGMVRVTWPIFGVRRYASVVYAVIVCLFFVCSSVCPLQVGVLPNRLNLWPRKQRTTIVYGLSFSAAIDLGETTMESPQQVRQIEVGWVKIGDFRPIFRYLCAIVSVDELGGINRTLTWNSRLLWTAQNAIIIQCS